MSRAPSGYFVVIDAEGAAIASSRRRIPAEMDHERVERIRAVLEAKAAPGCYVEFVPD